jgi:hypothetical protein
MEMNPDSVELSVAIIAHLCDALPLRNINYLLVSPYVWGCPSTGASRIVMQWRSYSQLGGVEIPGGPCTIAMVDVKSVKVAPGVVSLGIVHWVSGGYVKPAALRSNYVASAVVIVVIAGMASICQKIKSIWVIVCAVYEERA